MYSYIYYFYEKLCHRHPNNTIDYAGGGFIFLYFIFHLSCVLAIIEWCWQPVFLKNLFANIYSLNITKNKPIYTIMGLPFLFLFSYAFHKFFHKKIMMKYDRINPFSIYSIVFVLALFIVPVIIIIKLKTK